MKLFSRNKVKSLQRKYEKLMKESYELSKIDRTKADQKYAEAEEVLKQIEAEKNK